MRSVLKTQVVGRSAGRRKTYYCQHVTSATVTVCHALIFSINCVTKKKKVKEIVLGVNLDKITQQSFAKDFNFAKKKLIVSNNL